MSAWKESTYEVFIDYGSVQSSETVKAISKKHVYNKAKKKDMKIVNVAIIKIPYLE